MEDQRRARLARLVPRKFEHMKTPTEMGGVSEGLELAHQSWVRGSLLGKQPVATGFGEPGTLALEVHGDRAE